MDVTLAVSKDSHALLEPNLHGGGLLGIVLPSGDCEGFCLCPPPSLAGGV